MEIITQLPKRMNSSKYYLATNKSGDRVYMSYCEELGYCAKISSVFVHKYKGSTDTEGSIWSSSKSIMAKRLQKLGFIINN